MNKYTAKIMNSHLSKDIIKSMKRQIQGRRMCAMFITTKGYYPEYIKIF